MLALAAIVLLGFQPGDGEAACLATGQGPYQVARGDLDGDGFPDVVIPCRGELRLPSEKVPANDVLTVFLTEGRPEPHVRKDFRVGFGPYTAVVADLDGDSRQDVAVVNFQSNDGRDLSILWGDGSADRFGLAESIRIAGGPFLYEKNFTVDGRPSYPTPGLTSVATVDANRDGRPDLVAVAWSSDFFVVLLNRGDRSFSQQIHPLPPGPRDVVVADFSGDGIADLAFSIYSSNLVETWDGDGAGGFTHRSTFHSQGTIPYHLKAGDVDRDGRIDLVVGNRGPSDNVVVFLNRTPRFQFAGGFSAGTTKQGEATVDEIRDVLLYDEDGDGLLDLAIACHLSHKVVRWRGTGSTEFGMGFVDRRVDMFPGKGPRSLVDLRAGLGVVFYDSSEFAVMPSRSERVKSTIERPASP